MRFRIAVDVGGTFTDAVAVDGEGRLRIGKGLTTPERIFDGLRQALAVVAESWQLSVGELLQKVDLFIYGTTTATNAILEGRTARTAMLLTEGFPDVLVLREGGRFNAFDFTQPYPEPYIPRRLTFEIRERIDAEGEIAVPLDEEQVRTVLRELKRKRIEAVAVCLLWSIVNPLHEQAIGSLIEQELPGIPYTLSHQLNPIIREYRRASSTAIDASLKPLMQRHLDELQSDLREAGFSGDLLAASSLGGVMHIRDLAERPIYSVRSGLALAPVAARHYAQSEGQRDDVIVCDTGGTSFDVALIRNGQIKSTRETWLGQRFTGHMTGLSSVDIRSIGAGGGSIAWIDSGGLLRVGPDSAGADPGPACYGRGGERPTVTDAALVLGYIDPQHFLGGRMRLIPDAALLAVESIGDSLGLSSLEAAHPIMVIAADHMVQAIQDMTINEGVDPRDSLIVGGGGAAGLNILHIARELGCRRVLLPRTAAAFSACGGQYSDIVGDFWKTAHASTAEFPFTLVNDALGEIQGSIDQFQKLLEERGLQNFNTEYFVEARYPHQVWELEVALARNSFSGANDVEELLASFHNAHERVFAVRGSGHIECLAWKGRLAASVDRRPVAGSNGHGARRPVDRSRKAYFSRLGEVNTPIHLGEDLASGDSVEGPGIIEEPTTTLVVYPGSRITVTEAGNYLGEIGLSATEASS